MAEKIAREIERPVSMETNDLVDHLKAIGNAIVGDAEHLAVDTNRLRMVRVEAEIAPCEQITTVVYTLERAADPRLPRRTKAAEA